MLEIKKMRLPTNDEWDRLIDIVDEDDDIAHWKNILFWCQDADPDCPSDRAVRGCYAARYCLGVNDACQDADVGFRPSFEASGIEYLCDGATVTVGTLFMNGQPVKVPENPTIDGDIVKYLPGTRLEFRDAIDDPAYQVQAIKVGNILIADRVLMTQISWKDITQNTAPAESIATRMSSVLEQLLAENAENLANHTDIYAQGYHDAIVDVMKRLGFPTEELYFD